MRSPVVSALRLILPTVACLTFVDFGENAPVHAAGEAPASPPPAADSVAEHSNTLPPNSPNAEAGAVPMGDTAFPKVLWQRLSPGHVWGDVFHFRGYRIQEHGLDGTFRLLDPQRKRLALGTLADCHATFSAIREERNLAPMQGEVVILLHGIVRTARSLQSLQRHLCESGFEVIAADYPSTCCTIPECASYLRRLIDSLEGVEKVHLAVHSMGGLVVRAYFAEQPDSRIARVVMMGTPNYGAELATRLRGLAPFKWVFGPAGSQLASGPNEFVNDLPVPSVEFGIVAGARGNPAGFNPLVTGDDDGTVSVSSTRLAGATDFMTVYSMHAFLPGAPDTVVAVERFFRTGAFRESGERQPIE